MKCDKENVLNGSRLAFWTLQWIQNHVPSGAFLLILFLHASGKESAAGPACRAEHGVLAHQQHLWTPEQLCALILSASVFGELCCSAGIGIFFPP